MNPSCKHNIQRHSISMHASSCSVHMSIRNSILTRDAAVPLGARAVSSVTWAPSLLACACVLLHLPFSYETCMFTCRINFYCAFSLRASGSRDRLCVPVPAACF
jgi:hypothetical protein